MSNYLRNVAHRAAGASLLRPRVPSRFEPVAGMGPGIVTPTTTMNHFREVATEREIEAPHATQAQETRLPQRFVPAGVSEAQLVRASEAQPRREESHGPKPALTAHPPEEHTIVREKTDPERPIPLQMAHSQSDPVTDAARPAARNIRPGNTRETADRRLISREVASETVQPRPEPTGRTPKIEAPVPVSSVAPRFPARAPERSETIQKPALPQRVAPAEPPLRNRETAAVPSPAVHTQFGVPQIEVLTRDVHVTIGKVTVQATLPAAPAHAPARALAHTGPRLTLERYLDRRGGRP